MRRGRGHTTSIAHSMKRLSCEGPNGCQACSQWVESLRHYWSWSKSLHRWVHHWRHHHLGGCSAGWPIRSMTLRHPLHFLIIVSDVPTFAWLFLPHLVRGLGTLLAATSMGWVSTLLHLRVHSTHHITLIRPSLTFLVQLVMLLPVTILLVANNATWKSHLVVFICVWLKTTVVLILGRRVCASVSSELCRGMKIIYVHARSIWARVVLLWHCQTMNLITALSIKFDSFK